ncbi:hypothetical protein DV515_00004684 [Chloebia gouldiae]|uniref:Uncharacterized protein n=1 Tax=Chloebia gouldiae TaxID=44316 RepID=A0A3L8SQA3_CHLGU|nr:hypothetical protein DV515_00004684 [Chloebia gouldiae]
MEGGGDGHDIHLQVPVVLKSIFHVQNEDSLNTGWAFLEYWFQSPPHQAPQFLDLHLATGVLLGAKSRRRGHGSRGWMRWQLCHACAVLQTWTHLNRGRKHALRNRRGSGTSRTWELFYFHLA